MKIISWDIGIINMAYCVVDVDDDFAIIDNNKPVKNILFWNILNLIHDELETNQEQCYIASCKKKTEFTCNYMGSDIYWCSKHDNVYNILTKNKPCELSAKTKIKRINCDTITVTELRNNLLRQLDIKILPLIYKFKINYVLIESQPGLLNGKMKSLSDILYAWFFIRGINDSKIIKSIHLINPCNKLKEYVKTLSTVINSNEYKNTKLKSISVVSDYLRFNNLTTLISHLDSFPKKDDLCDCLLQCFYWIDKQFSDNLLSLQKIEKTKQRLLLKNNKLDAINQRKLIRNNKKQIVV